MIQIAKPLVDGAKSKNTPNRCNWQVIWNLDDEKVIYIEENLEVESHLFSLILSFIYLFILCS